MASLSPRRSIRCGMPGTGRWVIDFAFNNARKLGALRPLPSFDPLLVIVGVDFSD